MPTVRRGGKTTHLPYTPTGMRKAAAAKKAGAKVTYRPPGMNDAAGDGSLGAGYPPRMRKGKK